MNIVKHVIMSSVGKKKKELQSCVLFASFIWLQHLLLIRLTLTYLACNFGTNYLSLTSLEMLISSAWDILIVLLCCRHAQWGRANLLFAGLMKIHTKKIMKKKN